MAAEGQPQADAIGRPTARRVGPAAGRASSHGPLRPAGWRAASRRATARHARPERQLARGEWAGAGVEHVWEEERSGHRAARHLDRLCAAARPPAAVEHPWPARRPAARRPSSADWRGESLWAAARRPASVDTAASGPTAVGTTARGPAAVDTAARRSASVVAAVRWPASVRAAASRPAEAKRRADSHSRRVAADGGRGGPSGRVARRHDAAAEAASAVDDRHRRRRRDLLLESRDRRDVLGLPGGSGSSAWRRGGVRLVLAIV